MSEDCALGCGLPVNPHDLSTWHQVTGWVGGPKKDHSRLREYTGKVAHAACVQKLQEGQAVDQPDLFSKIPRTKKNAEKKSEPIPEGLFDD